MDLAYSDVRDVYPFVNKVYPREALVRIAARAAAADPHAATGAIAELVKFFVLHDKRMLWGHLLGEEDQTPSSAQTLTRGDIVAAVDDLGLALPSARRAAVVDEVAESTGATKALGGAAGAVGQPVGGLLGKTDERGLTKAAKDLWKLGLKVVVFGHTHEPELVSEKRLSGGTCARVNTGAWIPRIKVASGTWPTPAELGDPVRYPRTHELRFAWLELGAGGPSVTLEQL